MGTASPEATSAELEIVFLEILQHQICEGIIVLRDQHPSSFIVSPFHPPSVANAANIRPSLPFATNGGVAVEVCVPVHESQCIPKNHLAERSMELRQDPPLCSKHGRVNSCLVEHQFTGLQRSFLVFRVSSSGGKWDRAGTLVRREAQRMAE